MSGHDDERDAWLAQALRHAPDANADAPPLLSDSILREARAAVLRPAATSAAPRPASIDPLKWLASLLGWLARPPVAAGFASVMVATLVGFMWWDKPLDETLPRTPEVVSSTPQARADAAPPAVVAAAPANPEVQAAPPAPAAQKPGITTGAVATQGRLADREEAARNETERKGAERTKPEMSARASRPTDEATRMRSAADAAPAVAAAAPPPVAFPAAPQAPAAQAAAGANEARSPLEQRRELVAPAAKAATESPATAAADKAASPPSDLRALQGPASPALAKARSADAGDASLATLRARIAQQPERWRWQRGPGSPQAMNAAVQGWLAEVDRQAAPRWQASAANTAREPANSLRLFRDGVLQATLGLAGSAVWFEAIGASAPAASVAALPESAAESLRKALDEATP